jgi:hypothetical protein
MRVASASMGKTLGWRRVAPHECSQFDTIAGDRSEVHGGTLTAHITGAHAFPFGQLIFRGRP